MQSDSAISRSLPLVQPVKLTTIENAVTQIEREELRRKRGFLVENLKLLAHVAVDHAQNGGNAQATAKGKRHLRADVAEDQKGTGRALEEQPRQPAVESAAASYGKRALQPLRSPREASFDPQRKVNAGHAHHAPGGDFGVVSPPQKRFDPGEEPERTAPRESRQRTARVIV